MNTEIENFLSFSDVAETALMTFYCHVLENGNPQPILRDPRAAEIAKTLSPVLACSKSLLLRNLAKGKLRKELVVHITLRAQKCDEYARSFLQAHPDGIIVNLGCGLDSRAERIDNGRCTFFDLDLPEMIAFKRQFYKETARYRMLGSDVLDHAWMDTVARAGRKPVLILAEGLFMYLPPLKVKELVLAMQKLFPGSELVCEVVSASFTHGLWGRIAAVKMQRQLHLGKGTAYTFGVHSSREFEEWNTGIRFVDDWSYFDTHHPRLGMARLMQGSRWARTVQYTLHYRLDPSTGV